jgi:hypothetical protein
MAAGARLPTAATAIMRQAKRGSLFFTLLRAGQTLPLVSGPVRRSVSRQISRFTSDKNFSVLVIVNDYEGAESLRLLSGGSGCRPATSGLCMLAMPTGA